MNIALHGYGKMGKEIERLALERGWTISARIDCTLPPCSREERKTADVVIHFASPTTIVEDVEEWAHLTKPVVIGTTGWKEKLPAIEALVRDFPIGILYGANFSLGVNIFYRLLRTAGMLFDRFSEYDVFVHEIHHREKVDSPSGTALAIGDILLSTLQQKKELLTETSHGKIQPQQLHISSTRCGNVVGTHTVTFDSLADSIELTHRAKNRSGFALGALLAAEWIRDKHGLFTVDDMMNDIFH